MAYLEWIRSRLWFIGLGCPYTMPEAELTARDEAALSAMPAGTDPWTVIDSGPFENVTATAAPPPAMAPVA